MNEFSILCRVLGSLYYRQPQDPLLVPLFTLIREGKLAASSSSVKPAASRRTVARGWRVPRKRKFGLF